MSRSSNLRKARDAGYRARYAEEPYTVNPWRGTIVSGDASRRRQWVELRGAWYAGWDCADAEITGAGPAGPAAL